MRMDVFIPIALTSYTYSDACNHVMFLHFWRTKQKICCITHSRPYGSCVTVMNYFHCSMDMNEADKPKDRRRRKWKKKNTCAVRCSLCYVGSYELFEYFFFIFSFVRFAAIACELTRFNPVERKIYINHYYKYVWCVFQENTPHPSDRQLINCVYHIKCLLLFVCYFDSIFICFWLPIWFPDMNIAMGTSKVNEEEEKIIMSTEMFELI